MIVGSWIRSGICKGETLNESGSSSNHFGLADALANVEALIDLGYDLDQIIAHREAVAATWLAVGAGQLAVDFGGEG